jgi:hypothetical protein
MAEFPYWTDNWFATRAIKKKFDHLKEQVHDARAESVGDLRSIFSAIDQLEVDIGRTLLKLHAIADETPSTGRPRFAAVGDSGSMTGSPSLQ